MNENVVQLMDVAKSFKGSALLRDVSVAIGQGRSYGLVGPNGSGKSVLLRMIAGIMAPDRGRVIIDPRFLDESRVYPDRFGVFIDGPTYLGSKSGLANLQELAAIRKRTSGGELRSLMESVLLDPADPTLVKRYSLGMKQKIGLCQAFMEEPEVLLLDEPFSGLDTKSIAAVDKIIAEFRSSGRTIILASHNENEISRHTELTMRIDDGGVVLLKT